MKSNSGGISRGDKFLVSVDLAASMAKRSFRVPIGLLFLIAVVTVLSYRTVVRRCIIPLPLHEALVEEPQPHPPAPFWNATLLRLASLDVGEKEGRMEIEDLLDTVAFRFDRETSAADRSIASWRRFRHVGDGRKSSALIRIRTIKEFRLLPEFRRALRDWYRKRRYQPGVMSDLLSLVKAPIDRHRGGAGTPSDSRYRSCAVVGNSGILLQHEYGDLIDSHDLVIRLNNARISGYQRNVGAKTSLSFINSNILHLCARRESCFCHPYSEDVPIIMYICQAIHFLDYTACNTSYKAPLLITDARFDVLCARIVKYYSLKRFVEETGKAPEAWDKAHDAKTFHYSSGMQAVVLAVGICDRLSIFGFGKSTEAKHHYHTNQKKELDLHDYEAEYAFYRDLIERPQGNDWKKLRGKKLMLFGGILR